MIRILRRLLARHRAQGGEIGPPTSEAMWGELEDADLDPDDPITRLVRQARATGSGKIRHFLGDETFLCPSCEQDTLQAVYAHASTLTPEYAIEVATYCPNCPPEEDE